MEFQDFSFETPLPPLAYQYQYRNFALQNQNEMIMLKNFARLVE